MPRHRLDHVERPRLRVEAAEAVDGWLGGAARDELDAVGEERLLARAREQVAFHLGARAHEIVFTSGATESATTAVAGLLARAGGGHVVCPTGERPSLLAAVHRHADAVGWVEPEPTGWVDDRRLVAEIRADTALVCLGVADRRHGVLQPVDPLVAACADRGVATIVDTSVAAGRHRLDRWSTRPDVVVLDGHQLAGMPGIGAIAVRRGVRLEPLLAGGDDRSRRPGTPNLPGALALGAAAACLPPDVLHRERQHRDQLHQRLTRRLRASTDIELIGIEGSTVGLGVTVAVDDARATAARLADRGIAVEVVEPDLVRLAAGRSTTIGDVEAAAAAFGASATVHRLR